ncbi:MAG: hypothetical protein JNG86_15090 [Verrucomicrobiaceae bacterium]|nr:hypothetical protein [Verrucomicrobiaceae bacterium]
MISLTIFSIGVLQMSRNLSDVVGVANEFNKAQIVRMGMRSFLEEIRKKPLTEISMSQTDVLTGITYTSTTEPVSLKTTAGSILPDMYNLIVKATWTRGAEQVEDSLNIYVYKPAQQQQSSR